MNTQQSQLTDKLVNIIESRAEDLALDWYRSYKDSPYVPNLKNMPQEEATAMAQTVFKRLGHWLLPTSDHEVQQTYEKFGETMFKKGFRMEEVLMVLVLIKRHLWLHLLSEGLMTTNLEIYQALELNNRVVLYFDRAIYFSLIGYKQACARDREVKRLA